MAPFGTLQLLFLFTWAGVSQDEPDTFQIQNKTKEINKN